MKLQMWRSIFIKMKFTLAWLKMTFQHLHLLERLPTRWYGFDWKIFDGGRILPHFPWSPKKASVAEGNISKSANTTYCTLCAFLYCTSCTTQDGLPPYRRVGRSEWNADAPFLETHPWTQVEPLYSINLHLHLPSANFIICQVIFIHTISPSYKIYKNTHSLGVMKGPSIYHDVGNVFSAVSSIMPCIISAETSMPSPKENWQIWGH